MYTLSKCSSPSWDKQFDTLQELKDELEKWVCSLCIIEELNYWKQYEKMSIFDQINELLSTPCGCEFMVCGKTEEEIKRNEN